MVPWFWDFSLVLQGPSAKPASFSMFSDIPLSLLASPPTPGWDLHSERCLTLEIWGLSCSEAGEGEVPLSPRAPAVRWEFVRLGITSWQPPQVDYPGGCSTHH